MPKPNLSEQLDRAIQALLKPVPAQRRRDGAARNPQIAPLARVAGHLRGLPREDFKAILRAQLEGRTPMASKAAVAPVVQQTATAYLIVKGAARALEFYKQAFGAVEVMRLNGPGENIGHAEIRIGNTSIMLSDEFPDYGALSSETLGGSPVKIHLQVDDVDAVAARAVAAGARILRPVRDQFYGERSGQLADPFGLTWIIATHQETLTPDEMQRRFEDPATQKPEPSVQSKKSGSKSISQSDASTASASAKPAPPVPYIRAGFHTLTPYLLATGAAKLIEFLKAGFAAEEVFRVPGAKPNSIMHAELRLGESIVELSDGSPEFPPRPVWNAFYVDDADAVFASAIRAGATVVREPADQPWGDRTGYLKDPSGNVWEITTHHDSAHLTPDTRSLVPGFNPRGAAQFIEFLEKAFAAKEAFMLKSPDGKILHARIRIGDSILAVVEAVGQYPVMPFHLHVYVPDTDAVYQRALDAGAKSLRAPRNEPYGDRAAVVTDAFGNLWSLATHIKDVKF
ncbi:MAG: VOC family protein [Candidatus Acidiferrales bacterium]